MMQNLYMEELQFITGKVTKDMEYLVYLLLKNKEEVKDEKEPEQLDVPYLDEKTIDDWFNNL